MTQRDAQSTPASGSAAHRASRLRAVARLLRAPAVFGAVAGAAAFGLARFLPAHMALGTFGAIAGAWAGLWLARPLEGGADWRWLLPLPFVAVGLAAGGWAAWDAILAASAMTFAVAGLRAFTRRANPRTEWDDPALAAPALVSLVVACAALAWGLVSFVGGLHVDWPGAWAAASTGAVAAFAAALTGFAQDEHDPFDANPRHAVLLLAVALVVGATSLAFWSPRLVPLLAVGMLVLAAGGRPRSVGILGALVTIAALYMADRHAALLGRMLGGWPVASVLALLACVLMLSCIGSLLVHQRDRTRARLRATAGHLLTLAEKSPGLVATFDRSHRHRFFNDAYARWTGIGRTQLEGRSLVDVLGDGVAGRLSSSIARAMAGASQQLHVPAQGERLLDARLEPYFGLDGAIAGFHLLAEDITWRGQGERDLRALVAASPDPTLVLGEDGRIALHNDAALALFGATSEQLVGTLLAEWLSETGRTSDAADGAGMRARRGDGSTFPVDLRLGSMPGEHGGRSVVSLRDLSATRALENAARDAREQAQATLDSISDALVVCDLDSRILAFNPAATELTGWKRHEALGHTADEVVQLVDPAEGAPQASVLRETLQGGKPARLEGERELVRRDGARRPVEESASPLRDATGRMVGGVLMLRDVTRAREQAQALSHMAQHDFLTGLPNRVLFQDRLTQALAEVARGRRGAVLYIDLDRFKPINDSLGHPVGDRVLQEVASRLRACVREDDTVSRQGGDEFVLLLVRLADPRDAARVAEKLIRSIELPIVVDGHELRVGASVGISLFPQDGRDARTLMKQADTALYHVKESGRGRYSYFTDRMGEHAEARMRTEHDLRLALMSEDFVLDYQPVADAHDGRYTAVEALLRWRRVDGTILLPGLFLSVAEETGLIIQIDEWVMRKACLQNAAWQQAGLPRLPVSVNVSLARFDPERLLAQVNASLEGATLEAEWLEIEFRAEQLFPLGEQGRGLVADLRAMGVKVSVDDVATGRASVSELADFGFDSLKLDLAVVVGLPDDERSRRIAQAICQMGASLHCPVIAKGVESEACRDLLVEWGCAGLQGALFSPPMPSERMPALLDPREPHPLARRA